MTQAAHELVTCSDRLQHLHAPAVDEADRHPNGELENDTPDEDVRDQPPRPARGHGIQQKPDHFCWIRVNLTGARASCPVMTERRGSAMVDRDGWEAFGSPVTSRAAVSELFHAHYRRLVGLAGLMVDSRETAEEVVQDSFESLYRNWSRLRDPQAAVEYLNRSVVNGSRSHLRHRRTVRSVELPEADVVPSAEARGVDLSRQRDLAAAVRQLPRRQREVMVLRYFLDLSEIEIAAWLGVSPGSVKRHASRAIESLRKRMEAWA